MPRLPISRVPGVPFVAFVPFVATLASGIARGQSTERVSVSSSGAEANSSSFGIYGLSADGNRVLFDSVANNLVSNDTNTVADLFLRDRAAGTTVRVNVSSSGAETTARSGPGVLSADGNFVLFDSLDGGLVSGDTNNEWDVFLRDLAAGTTERVNVDGTGAQNSDGAEAGAISADGSLLLFSSDSLAIVPTKTTNVVDVFLLDRVNGTLEQLLPGLGGAEADGDTYAKGITPDGRYVLLHTRASNLVASDTNGLPDAYVFDRQTGTSVRVSVDEKGNEVAFISRPLDLSPDGRFVAFSTQGPMVAADKNGLIDVYVRDLVAGTIEPASVNSSGRFGSSGPLDSAVGGSLSDDGRYVCFWTKRALSPDDTNSWNDVFVRDRELGTTSRASVASDGTGGNDFSSGWDAMSADGAVVAFFSLANNLVASDLNKSPDIFVHVFDRTDAKWSSYGAGVAGTLGIPTLTPSHDPELNQPLDLSIASSATSTSVAAFFLGLASAQWPTGWGGDLLVDPTIAALFLLPPGITTVSGAIPPDEHLCGTSLFLQMLQIDAGAAQGVAFTAGLELVLGR